MEEEYTEITNPSVDVPILCRTQSGNPIISYGTPVERTNEIKGDTTSLVRSTCFPIATDRIVGLSSKVDRGL